MPPRRSVALSIPAMLLFCLSLAAPVRAIDPPTSAIIQLTALLSGDEVVPGPGAIETGIGSADMWIDTTAGSLCWTLRWEGIDEPTSAALWQGLPGEVGAPVVDLVDPLSDGCQDGLDAAVLEAIAIDPSAHYLQLATPAYPDGAIRGQLEFSPPTSFVTVWASLSGSSVMPGGGDAAAGGWVQLDIDVQGGSVCTWWAVSGLDDATTANVHAGTAGAVGDVVLDLPPPSLGDPTKPPADGGPQPGDAPLPPDGTPPGDPGGTGCLTGIDSAALQAIADDPASFYVDVHTSAYPDGAVRGQLSFEPPPPPPCEAPMVCDGLIGPGDYEYYGFSRLLFFSLADAWQAANAGNGFSLADASGLLSFFAFSGSGAEDACGTAFASVGTTAGELADWLAAHPALTDVHIGPATIGGLTGLQVDALVSLPEACGTPQMLLLPAYGIGVIEPGSGGGTDGSDSGGSGADGGTTNDGAGAADVAKPQAVQDGEGYWVTSGDRLRLFVVDLDWGPVVVALGAPDGDAFAALAGHAQAVLDSVTWGPEPIPADTGGAPGSETDGGNDLPNTASPRNGDDILGGVLLLACLAGVAGLAVGRLRVGARMR